MSTNLVYKSLCTTCNPYRARSSWTVADNREIPSIYIGETSRSLKERSAEQSKEQRDFEQCWWWWWQIKNVGRQRICIMFRTNWMAMILSSVWWKSKDNWLMYFTIIWQPNKADFGLNFGIGVDILWHWLIGYQFQWSVLRAKQSFHYFSDYGPFFLPQAFCLQNRPWYK